MRYRAPICGKFELKKPLEKILNLLLLFFYSKYRSKFLEEKDQNKKIKYTNALKVESNRQMHHNFLNVRVLAK